MPNPPSPTTDAVERVREALEPVLYWYQSDEHAPRPLEDIIADIVVDLQHDRALALSASKMQAALRAASALAVCCMATGCYSQDEIADMARATKPTFDATLSTPIRDDVRAELAALSEKATLGPWEYNPGAKVSYYHRNVYADGKPLAHILSTKNWGSKGDADANAAFIVAAVNLVRNILAESRS